MEKSYHTQNMLSKTISNVTMQGYSETIMTESESQRTHATSEKTQTIACIAAQ